MPKFPENAFFNVSVGLESISGNIECFGDFNSDRYTDIFVVDTSRQVVSLYLWKTADWKFVFSLNFTSDLLIKSISASDFNYDGKLDILIQGSFPNDYEEIDPENPVGLEWYEGDYNTLVSRGQLPSSSIPVVIMDANSDLIPDLFGQRIENGTAARYYWLNSPAGNFSLVKVSDNYPLAKIHSNAFVDFTGDCLADLVVKSDNGTLEFLANRKTFFETLLLKSNTTTIPGTGQITYGDFDSDGAIDLLFPVCWPEFSCSEVNSIHVIYNVQQRTCQSAFDSNCRPETDLCRDVGWGIPDLNSAEKGTVVIVDKKRFRNSTFYVNSKFPFITIRAGDFNLDGFDDIVFTTKRNGHVGRIELWESVACDNTMCSPEATNSGRRTFKLIPSSQSRDLLSIHGAYAAAFFDLDEDGTSDLLVMAENSTTTGVYAIFNNIIPDAYFFKTLGLNGVCTEGCPLPNPYPDPKPFGVNFHGATIKFSYADLSGVVRSPAAPQLPQSSHLALLTPYTLAGLGRPSNYISYFYLGVTYARQTYFSWSGIIPNSQVVGIPVPDTTEWRAELYLSLSGTTLWIIIAVTVCCLILGSIVLVLRRKEKLQDVKENKEKDNYYLFSFKAL